MADYFGDLRFIRAQLQKHRLWLENCLKTCYELQSDIADVERAITLTAPNDITLWRIFKERAGVAWYIMANPKYDFATRVYLYKKLTSEEMSYGVLRYAAEYLTLADVKQLINDYPDQWRDLFEYPSNDIWITADAYEYLLDNYGYDNSPYLNHRFGNATMPLPVDHNFGSRLCLSDNMYPWLPALDESNCDQRAISHVTVAKYDIISATPKDIIRRMHAKFGPYETCCGDFHRYRLWAEWEQISIECSCSVEMKVPYEHLEFNQDADGGIQIAVEYYRHYRATLMRAIYRGLQDWQEISSSPGGVHYHSCMHDM